MRFLERLGRAILILTVFGIASYFSMQSGTGGLWRDYNDARVELDELKPVEAKVRRSKLVAADREALVLLGDPTVRCG